MPKLSESLDQFIEQTEREDPIIDPGVLESLEWTGLGCDCCGYGTVENVDEFDPGKPCPECGSVMVDHGVDEQPVG